jgi:hypothetical protein
MSQFRSEEMNLVQLFVQSDAAHETLHELGQIGAIQFKDVSALRPLPPNVTCNGTAHYTACLCRCTGR